MKTRIACVFSMIVLLLTGVLAMPWSLSSAAVTQDVVVESIFEDMSGFLDSRADQYGIEIDISQSKLFQFGQSPAIVAPITSFDISNLGLVGLLEVGGPFEVEDTMLPGGSYRMELGGNAARRQLMLHLRDEFGQRVASIAASQVRSLRIPRPSSGLFGSNANGVNSLGLFGLIGPTISFTIVPQRQPPFIRTIRPCIGFLLPFASRFLSVGFCF